MYNILYNFDGNTHGGCHGRGRICWTFANTWYRHHHYSHIQSYTVQCPLPYAVLEVAALELWITHLKLAHWSNHDLSLNTSSTLSCARSLVVRWVVGSILHGVDPLSNFSFQPVLHDWCNKGRGMCYHVCEMVHIKEPLLLIENGSQCGGSGFPLSLSEWSFTICPTPYNRK